MLYGMRMVCWVDWYKKEWEKSMLVCYMAESLRQIRVIVQGLVLNDVVLFKICKMKWKWMLDKWKYLLVGKLENESRVLN